VARFIVFMTSKNEKLILFFNRNKGKPPQNAWAIIMLKKILGVGGENEVGNVVSASMCGLSTRKTRDL